MDFLVDKTHKSILCPATNWVSAEKPALMVNIYRCWWWWKPKATVFVFSVASFSMILFEKYILLSLNLTHFIWWRTTENWQRLFCLWKLNLAGCITIPPRRIGMCCRMVCSDSVLWLMVFALHWKWNIISLNGDMQNEVSTDSSWVPVQSVGGYWVAPQWQIF